MEQNIRASMAALTPHDILITPELSDISPLDFANGTKGIPAGEAAALTASTALKTLALSETDYAQWQAARAARRPSAPLVGSLMVGETHDVDPAYFSLPCPAHPLPVQARWIPPACIARFDNGRVAAIFR